MSDGDDLLAQFIGEIKSTEEEIKTKPPEPSEDELLADFYGEIESTEEAVKASNEGEAADVGVAKLGAGVEPKEVKTAEVATKTKLLDAAALLSGGLKRPADGSAVGGGDAKKMRMVSVVAAKAKPAQRVIAGKPAAAARPSASGSATHATATTTSTSAAADIEEDMELDMEDDRKMPAPGGGGASASGGGGMNDAYNNNTNNNNTPHAQHAMWAGSAAATGAYNGATAAAGMNPQLNGAAGAGGAGGGKAHVRKAGGNLWVDKTLDEWPENDFRIFVGDLGNEVTDGELAQQFKRWPSFAKAKIVRETHTKKSKGYGFVSFTDGLDMMKALREMNGKYVGNRPMKLKKSNWKEREIKEVYKKEKQKKKWNKSLGIS